MRKIMDYGYDEIITLLCNGISQRKLYFNSHPKVQDCSRDIIEKLKALLIENNKDIFFLGIVEGKLVHDGRYLVGPTILGSKLLDFAEKIHSGGFLIRNTVETEELCEFFSLAAEMRETTESLEEAQGMMRARNILNIEISPVYEDPGWFGQYLFAGEENQCSQSLHGESLKEMIQVNQSLYDTVENAHTQAGCDHSFDMNAIHAVTEKLIRSTKGDFMDMMQIVRYPNYDSYTVGHSVRVALIAVVVAHSLGMDQKFLLDLGTAGLLHDIGKSKISEKILYKQGELFEEEWRDVEAHPYLGARILLENENVSSLALAATWGHHRRFDGKGYPDAPDWVVMNRATAFLHVCDVFEALTAVRPYKEAVTPRRAYEIMLEDTGNCDPAALSALISAIGIYPPGSLVELSSGEQGIVIEAGADIEKPKVKVLRTTESEDTQVQSVCILDLSLDEYSDLSVADLKPAQERAEI